MPIHMTSLPIRTFELKILKWKVMCSVLFVTWCVKYYLELVFSFFQKTQLVEHFLLTLAVKYYVDLAYSFFRKHKEFSIIFDFMCQVLCWAGGFFFSKRNDFSIIFYFMCLMFSFFRKRKELSIFFWL